MAKTRIAALASGRGSNLQSIIDSIEQGEIDAEVVLVISDNKDAKALERARKHGIKAVYISPAEYGSRLEYDEEILRQLQEHNIDLVLLAGYMRVVKGDRLLREYAGRMMNIHPALLPSFPGLHGQKQALDYGVKVSGATVHFVDENLDAGPIIIQVAVPVEEDDTEDSLAARILKEEHRIYPAAVKLFCKGKLKIEGRRVRVLD